MRRQIPVISINSVVPIESTPMGGGCDPNENLLIPDTQNYHTTDGKLEGEAIDFGTHDLIGLNDGETGR
jgi:hypothetical protein